MIDFIPLVVVRSITYNHASFIEDAMNGFCMQRTSFPFVCTIIDDCSTDGEPAVIENYLQKHFDLDDSSIVRNEETEDYILTFARNKTNKNCYFAVYYLKYNHYSTGNNSRKDEYIKEWFEQVKYVAFCEGDDYWTDLDKLQKQVSFLEKHPDYSMCTHVALWERNGKLYKAGCQHSKECTLSSDEVIRFGGLYLATASLVFRKELADDWPKWRKLSDVGDYPLQILGTLRGGMHYFPEPMCVYRFQYPGSWTNRDSCVINTHHLKTEIAWMKVLDEDTCYVYTDAIYSHLIQFYSTLYLAKQLSFADYYGAYKRTSALSFKRFFKDVLIKNFNWLYKLIKK